MVSNLFRFILGNSMPLKQAPLLYALLTIMAGNVYADEDVDTKPVDIEDVYRIEIIVFTNQFSQSEEKWTRPATPSYPDDLIFLKQTVEVNQDSLTKLGDATDSNNHLNLADAAITPLVQTSNTVLSDTATNKNIVDTQTIRPDELLPELLTKIEANNFVLQDSAKRLQRRAAYKILFHEAWYQALNERQSAASIPLHGGQQYDDHYQLEGSVRFSKNRFLHITTNLWLSEFTPLPTQNSYTPWYQDIVERINLPVIPTPPIVEQPIMLPSNIELNQTNDSLPSIEEELANNSPERSMLEIANKTYHYGNEMVSDNSEQLNQAVTQEYVDQSVQQPPEYAANKVYNLKEYRRIKRDELHYLDHPKFGVIVTISKYEAKQHEGEKNK